MKNIFLIVAFLSLMTVAVGAEEKPKAHSQKPKVENRHREHHDRHDHWSFGFGFSDHRNGFSIGIGHRNPPCYNWVPGHYETRIDTIMTCPGRWERFWNGHCYEEFYCPPVYEKIRISVFVPGYWEYR